MTIQEFIEKAIEGGWNSKSRTAEFCAGYDDEHIAFIFLDPAAWKAVVQVDGWPEYVQGHCGKNSADFDEQREKVDCCWFGSQSCEWFEKGYEYRMHRMIDALAEGKTIEHYLETL